MKLFDHVPRASQITEPRLRWPVASCVVMLIGVWLRASVAYAYRPFDATDASVAETGELELEIGPFGYLREQHEQFLVAPALVANWGFAEGFELVFEGRELVLLHDHLRASSASVTDTTLSLKNVWRDGSLQDGAGPSIATEWSILLPTIRGESGVGVAGALIVSQRWDVGSIHFDGGVAVNRATRLVFVGSVIIEGPNDWVLRPVAELSAAREIALDTTLSGLLGLIWRVDNALSFDVAARIERVGELDAYEARAGLTWAFPVIAR
jgi:hypothetical protein